MLEHPAYWGGYVLNQQSDREIRDAWTVLFNIDGFWDAGEIVGERLKRAGRHGTVSMDAYYGSKPITMTGEIRARNLGALRAKQRELQSNFRSLEPKELKFRLWDEVAVVGMARKVQVLDMPEVQSDARYARGFVIGLELDDPYLYSETWNLASVTVGGTPLNVRMYTGSPGVRTYDQPGNTRIYSSVTVPEVITNEGSVESHPILVIRGPMVNPVVRNETTDKEVRWDGLTIAADETYRVDMTDGSVYLNSITETYEGLDILGSEFWTLEPGDNEVTIEPFSWEAGAGMDVYWRSAFG